MPLIRINFPEDYSDSQERCRVVARQLSQQHPHENILLVGMLSAAFKSRRAAQFIKACSAVPPTRQPLHI